MKGALLVAPSDPEQPGYPREISGFDPVRLTKLPFPSILVASTNDEAVSVDRAGWFARHWGSEFILLDRAGHIDQKTGYGAWNEGKKFLKRFP